MATVEGMREDDVADETAAVFKRKKVPLDALSIVSLMQVIVDDPSMGLTHAALQQWYQNASSQAIFMMYNRVERLYRAKQGKQAGDG